MKKAKILLALLVVFAVCMTFAACKTAEYKLDKTTLTLTEGQTQQLTVSSSLDNEFSVEYKSSNTAVAIVSDSGLVTAVKEGTATITATVDKTELTCSVTVKAAEKPVVYEYSLNKTALTIEEGATGNLSVKVTPEKTISVTWSSDADAVATVNQNGVVTGVKAGTANIKASVDGKELVCKVTVEKAPPVYTLTPSGQQTLEKGKTLQLNVTSSEQDDDFTVVWTSDNGEAATVSDSGLVTAVAKGTAKITATIGEGANAVKKTCTVTVFEYEYTFEQSLSLLFGAADAKLTVSVTPEKTLDISYIIKSGESVTIDEEGNITTVGTGETTVTIKDGEKEIGECVITVNALFTAKEQLQMHVGDQLTWTITAEPSDTTFTAVYEVAEGEDVVEIAADGKITAKANGTAKITATIGEKVLRCDVLVNNVNAGVEQKDLTKESIENLSGEGIAYWENYINREINFKSIASAEEDVINATLEGAVGYLPDYAKLVWTDGSSECAKPSKPNGWSEGATIAVTAPGQEGVKVTLAIQVYAGETQIKVYTGVFKGTCTATLYNGTTAIASYVMENFNVMTLELLTFDVDVTEACELTIELVLTNAKAENSFITLAGVSVSGSTYQLEESSKRLIPDGTATIVMNKDGVAMTEGVTYAITEGNDVVSVENGVVTALKLGTAKIAVTADGRTRIYSVEVGYTYSLDADSVSMHVGDNHTITVVSDPEGAQITANYEVTDLTIVSIDEATGVITALKNGKTTVKVTVDQQVLELEVTVSDVNVNSSVTSLENDREKPIDITEGAEYWEQYIDNGEVNHKHYINAEEDIINKSSTVDGKFLGDYAAFLNWHGGATRDNCSCGLCAKDADTTPDGGWTNGGTKAMAVNVKDAIISLQFKLFAGESTIKIYTGGYNLTGRVQLKLDGEVIAEQTFSNKLAHISYIVSFTVNTVNACEVTAELVMTDDFGDAPNSCISLAAASVSGDTYQLEKASERVIPNGTAQIVLKKNGVEMTSGVTYEVVTEEGAQALATVSETGLVTAGEAVGTATVKVTADGRTRYFTVNIGYDYSVDVDSVTLTPAATHQINVVSSPAGSAATISYTSGDETVATVDINGLITAVAKGKATITAEVEGKQFTVIVVVSDVEVEVKNERLNGQFVNLNSSEVLYWEHYLYGEKASMTLGEGQKDLIAGEVDGKNGDAGYGAHIYFTNAQGVKHDSYQDGAFGKFSWGEHFSFDLTIPQGTWEVRIYTGAWENTANKVSLIDEQYTLASYTIPKTAGGIGVLVTFTVTVETEKTLTVELKALEGNNCRLAAIAIADPSVTSNTTSVNAGIEEVTDSTQINLTEKGNLDWTAFSDNTIEKANADLIGTLTLPTDGGNGQGTDYKGNLSWTDAAGDNAEGSTHNFKWHDFLLDVNVKVNADTKQVTLYLSGWKTTYGVFVTDKNGNTLYSDIVCTGDGSNSKAVAVTFDITAAEADELTFSIRKIDKDGNLGIAAIAVAGEVATLPETPEVTE